MAKSYKTASGRIIQRQANGKFRKTTLADFGIETNDDYRYCTKCNYGKKEAWFPIVKDGYCPECGSSLSKPISFKLTDKAIELQLKIKEISEAPFIDPSRISEFKNLEREFNEEYREIQRLYFNKLVKVTFDVYRGKENKLDVYIPKTITRKKDKYAYIRKQVYAKIETETRIFIPENI